MFYKSITAILLLAPCLLFSQTRSRSFYSDLQLMGLKGRVKEIVTLEYSPSRNGTLEIFDFFGSNNYKQAFNTSGYLTSKIDFRKDRDSLKSRSVWTYSYGKDNRISRERIVTVSSTKDTLGFTYTYIGDSLTKVRTYHGKIPSTTYYYLLTGNRELLTVVNADSSNISRTHFSYDHYHRVNQIEEYGNTDSIKRLWEISYIDTTSMNRHKAVLTQGNDRSYEEYIYDKHQNRLKWISGNFQTDHLSVHSYEYVYDRQLNWIERKHYLWNGYMHSVTKRQIAYYDDRR